MPTQPHITPTDDTEARREVLAMYRHDREAGVVPIVAMGEIRRLFADCVARTIVETGAVDPYWMTRYVVAADYTRRLTARAWHTP